MSNGFYIPNHKSHVVHVRPFSEITDLPERPPFATKDLMLAWAHDDATQHCFYNLAEARDPGRRVTKDNPVAFIHGVVADFDTKVSRAALIEAVGKFPVDFKPAYACATFSGGARIIWLFAKKLPVYSPEICKAVLTRLKKETKAAKFLGGLDEPAFIDPARYFELGTDWLELDATARVSAASLAQFVFEASSKTDWRDQGVIIPMDAIAIEVERRWPGRWTGPFAVGAMGTRFWDATSTNDNGAWIRETGVQAFSGEARFMPWAEILGVEFVTQFERDRIGGATDGLYFDGKAYWIKNSDNNWDDYNSENTQRYLVSKGLRKEGRRGEASEVERAMTQLAFQGRVAGAFPFLYRNEDRVSIAGKNYLNVLRVPIIVADSGKHAWGDGFPWLASYLEQIFSPDQLQVFLGWLGHFYRSAAAGKLRKGQALFVAGPQGIGKTFLSQIVIGGLMGGAQEATNFLLGKTEFNAEMFTSPCWSIDDSVAAAEGKAHEVYSQIVKKVVANYNLTYRRMYSNPITMPWEGRIVVTLNNDPESIAMLPNVEASMLDKVIFLLATPTTVNFQGGEEAVRAELPCFASFLRDAKIPDHLVGDYRYGVKEFHHPELLQEAKLSSSTNSISELLDIWRHAYFLHSDHDKMPDWSGNMTELLQELHACDSIKPILQKYITSRERLGRDINKLIKTNAAKWITAVRHGDRRDYKITRP